MRGVIMEKRHNEVIKVTTVITKWGNSLGVRIPMNIAKVAELENGSEVELIAEDAGIMIKLKNQKPNLDDLLSKVTAENKHTEINFGGPEGNEMF